MSKRNHSKTQSIQCSDDGRPYVPHLPSPLCSELTSIVKKAFKTQAGPLAHLDRIKHKLPANYVNKRDTVILIDSNDNPILKDNGDGTVSGIPIDPHFAIAH